MIRPRLKTILISFSTLVTLTIIIISITGFYFFQNISAEMQEKLLQKKFLNPTELYAQPLQMRLNKKFSIEAIRKNLIQEGFRERSADEKILEKDFKLAETESCRTHLESVFKIDHIEETPLLRSQGCLLFRTQISQELEGVFYDENNLVIFLFKATNTA